MPRTGQTILLVEDDASMRRLVARILAEQGYRIWEAASAAQAFRLLKSQRPDLIVSDWVLGGRPQGIDICSRLKKLPETRSIPIIVMSAAKITFEDELTALSSGADLYLNKSQVIEGRESDRFFQYVRSLLARPFKAADYPEKAAEPFGLQIDLAAHTVKTRAETVVDLPTKLFDVLYLLAKHYPRVLSRRYIVRYLWKSQVRDREVAVAVSRLKSRIEKGKDRIIESVIGRGYRLRVVPSIIAGSRRR